MTIEPGSKSLRRQFEKPDSKYHLVPFWAWNGEMKEDILLDQLYRMKQQGISEFIIMAFWPLSIPYCEGEWWDRVDLTLRYCKEHGMKVWIYDEYSWPSGACGGKVLRDHPWTRNVVMGYKGMEVAPGEIVSEEIAGSLLSATILQADHKPVDVSDAVTIRPKSIDAASGNETAAVEWRNPYDKPVKFYLFIRNICDELLNIGVGAPWSWGQRGYLNTLDSKAVQVFIDSTYEEYAKRFGSYFGNVIRGFFTDEPALSYHGTTYGGSCMPYTDGLFDFFRERYGYDLKPRIVELLQDIGDYRKTRYDFWALATSLFTNSYHRQLRQWCDKHNLMLMGHPVWEEALGWNIIFSGDIYEGNKWYHAPGFDLLQTDTSFEDAFMENSIHLGIKPNALAGTAKIEQSTARHAGAPRVMCEAYGVGPWSQTMEDQRKVTDWVTGLGTDLIVDCLIPYSSHGFLRSRLCGKNLYSPWWKYYGQFNEYAARMCAMAGECELKTEIGVVFPMASAWSMMNESLRPNKFILLPENRNTSWGIMQEAHYFVPDALLRSHWDYDFIFTSVFEDSRIEDGKFVAPNSSYSTLILPGMVTLTSRQLDMILAFAQSGGNVVFVAAVPGFCSDGAPGGRRDIKGAMEQLMGLDNVKLLPLSAVQENDISALDNLLKSILPKEIELRGDGTRNILKAHRTWNGHDVILLANQSAKPVKVDIDLLLRGSIQIWDPFTAKQYSAPGSAEPQFGASISANVGGISFLKPGSGNNSTRTLSYEFAPHESIFVVAQPSGFESQAALPTVQSKSWRYQTVLEQTTLSGPWEFSLENENLYLPDWLVRVDKDGIGEEQGWHLECGDENWVPSSWSEAEVDLDPDTNKSYWQKVRIRLQDVPEKMSILVDIRFAYPAVFVNGRKITECESYTLWDPENGRFNIAKYLQPGQNTIIVQGNVPLQQRRSKVIYIVNYKDIDPAVLMGDFVVNEDGSLRASIGARNDIKAGSWHAQGYPNYAGTASYCTDFQITELNESERIWLNLGKVADVAEVWVNQKHVATLPLSPYEADITDFVRLGNNRLEIKVTNNFGNLLFGMWTGRVRHFTPAGLLNDPVLIRNQKGPVTSI